MKTLTLFLAVFIVSCAPKPDLISQYSGEDFSTVQITTNKISGGLFADIDGYPMAEIDQFSISTVKIGPGLHVLTIKSTVLGETSNPSIKFNIKPSETRYFNFYFTPFVMGQVIKDMSKSDFEKFLKENNEPYVRK